MTILDDPPAHLEVSDEAVTPDAPAGATTRARDDDGDGRAPVRPVALAVSWFLITVAGIALVLLAVGPISEERDQRALLDSYRAQIESASNQAFGLGGVESPTEAPTVGAAVGIIDIERIGVSRVVVEGTGPAQTRQGPGHVVGTGGPGQPGNSVVVGRQALFGAPFARLGEIQVDDRILVTTDQGRSVYTVEHVGPHAIVAETTENSPATESSTPTTIDLIATDAGAPDGGADARAEDEADEPMLADGPLTAEALYGPSPDDRLTLVTTASGGALAGDEALVVVARMEGQPFAPTPQGGRTLGDDGRSGASGNVAPLVLALLAYVVAVIGAIWLNRNVPWRSAYLLSAPVLVALTIVLADELAALLPAWT